MRVGMNEQNSVHDLKLNQSHSVDLLQHVTILV